MLSFALLGLANAEIFHVQTNNKAMVKHLDNISSKTPNITTHLVVGTSKFDGNTAILFGYHAAVQIGTPSQTFEFVLDSGSPWFWMLSSNCSLASIVPVGSVASCHPLAFNGSSSSTYSTTNLPGDGIMYGEGSHIYSVLSSDTVSVLGASVSNFTFNEVPKTVDGITRNDYLNGIIGLSRPWATKAPSFFQALMETKTLESNVISYYIDSTNTRGGVTFGGADTARMGGQLTWLPKSAMSASSMWASSVLSISINNSSITIPNNFEAVFDTGTSFAYFPNDVANAINQGLNLTNTPSGWGFPCPNGKIPTNRPLLSLQFNGISIQFTADEYMYRAATQQGLYCLSGISGSSMHFALLGNVLLRKLYLVYDYPAGILGITNAIRDSTVKSNFVGLDSKNSSVAGQVTTNDNVIVQGKLSLSDATLSKSSLTYAFLVASVFLFL